MFNMKHLEDGISPYFGTEGSPTYSDGNKTNFFYSFSQEKNKKTKLKKKKNLEEGIKKVCFIPVRVGR